MSLHYHLEDSYRSSPIFTDFSDFLASVLPGVSIHQLVCQVYYSPVSLPLLVEILYFYFFPATISYDLWSRKWGVCWGDTLQCNTAWQDYLTRLYSPKKVWKNRWKDGFSSYFPLVFVIIQCDIAMTWWLLRWRYEAAVASEPTSARVIYKLELLSRDVAVAFRSLQIITRDSGTRFTSKSRWK